MQSLIYHFVANFLLFQARHYCCCKQAQSNDQHIGHRQFKG